MSRHTKSLKISFAVKPKATAMAISIGEDGLMNLKTLS